MYFIILMFTILNSTTWTTQTEIPHFKEVVIMATTCDVCGDKSSEVKSGGTIIEIFTFQADHFLFLLQKY